MVGVGCSDGAGFLGGSRNLRVSLGGWQLSSLAKGPVFACMRGPEAPPHSPLLFQGDTGAQGLPGPPGEDGERVSDMVGAGSGLRKVHLFNMPSFSRAMMERLGPGGCLESR